MSIDNQQQNLINDLKAPIKSFRLFALEDAIKNGASQEVLDVLERLKIEEDDGECQVLINYAISAVAERIAGKEKKPPKKIKEQQEFVEQWQNAQETEKIRILSNLPSRLPQGLRAMGPDLLCLEKSAVVAARIIRVFCRHWPEEKFDLIKKMLESNSLSLRLASLKTMVHMKPELLTSDLPALLSSEDPQIKALAIRALVKIDKDEALKHLQALLLSSSLSDRLAGIQNCPFLPFEMVKPVLLKYFAAENHPELLIRAGWILEMNPDIQVPFKLFEIAERSPEKKAALVKKILSEAVGNLEKSGILGNKFPIFTKKLQAWVNKRNILRFVKKIVARLDGEVVQSELDALIRSKLKQPLVKEVFTEALVWPLSELVRQRMRAYLSGMEKATDPKITPDISSSAEFEEKSKTESKQKGKSEKVLSSLPEQKQEKSFKDCFKNADEPARIKILANLEKQNAGQILDELKKLAAGKNVSSELRIAAIHSFTRLKMKGLEPVAEKLVTASDVPLATAALEYMGEIDPEAIFPYIGQCLKVADIRMKSVALGILKNFDFNQAVSSLNAMLNANDPKQQKMALECMDQFDFALIREQLTEFLEKCDNEELVEAGLCHFAANPAADNVYSLYKIEKAQAGNIAQQVQKLRESCKSAASEAQLDNSEVSASSEEELRQKYQEEQKKKKRAKPAYAYREKQKSVAPEGIADNFKALVVTLKEFGSSKGLYIVLIILLVMGAVFYVLFVPSSTADTRSDQGKAIVSGQYLREGTINRSSGTAVEFESVNGEKFVFHPTRDGYRMPAIGVKLRVSLVPYRRNPDGTYLARVRAMRSIESFSTD